MAARSLWITALAICTLLTGLSLIANRRHVTTAQLPNQVAPASPERLTQPGGGLTLEGLQPGSEAEPQATAAADGHLALLPHLDNGLVTSKDELLSVGHLGGPAWDVATDGRTAFMGLGPRLLAFDITVADTARQIGTPLPFADVVQGLELVGPRLYLAAGRAGLVILDVSDPAAPRRLGGMMLAGPAQDVAWDGQHLFVAADTAGLLVLDVADPQRPVEVGAIAGLPEWPVWRVLVNNGLAFVLSPPLMSDAAIVDVRDPTAPRTISLITEGPAETLASDGHYLYVGGFTDVKVFDLSQLADPPLPVATIPTEAHALALAGDRLYVGTDEAFEVWDVLDPRTAHRVSSSPTTDSPAAIVLTGRRALVTHNAHGAYTMFDPPVGNGCMWTPAGSLRAIDLTDEAKPQQTELLATPSKILDIAIAGEELLVLDSAVNEPVGRLWVADIQQPDSPYYVASLALAGHVWSMAVTGGHAYVVETGIGLEVVDLTDPRLPRHVAQLDMPGNGHQIVASGNTVFVAAANIQAIDVTDPVHPRLMGSVAVDASFGGLAAANGFLYTLAYSGDQATLLVYNASDPAHLSLTGSVVLKDIAWSPVADGHHVYMTMLDGGIAVVDVSDPAQPTLVGAAPGVDSYFGSRLTIAGKRAYVGGSAVAAYDISQPAAPRQLASAELPTYGCDIVFASRLAAIGETLVTVGPSEFTHIDLGLMLWRFGAP